ncbi:hypothetical protein SNE40_022464 [Patella caerulea]|uniref:nicotinamidase n=1 Tax=Patella caerulea TaxID=87958 RepID=A0AAN8IVT7_PATCE
MIPYFVFILSALCLLEVNCKNALLIIDVQDCFLKGGNLAVTGGNDIIPVINRIRNDYKNSLDLVVFSQDWHCSDHVSFASQHIGYQPYQTINLTYNSQGELCYGEAVGSEFAYAVNCSTVSTHVLQTLWPDHCIKNVSQGPTSSKLDPGLVREDGDVIIYKGQKCGIDAYSAFYDNAKITQTQLNSVLRDNEITKVFITGMASDFCVYYTALDAKSLGYETFVVKDAVRGVANESIVAAAHDMTTKGINLILSTDLKESLSTSSGNIIGPTCIYMYLISTYIYT